MEVYSIFTVDANQIKSLYGKYSCLIYKGIKDCKRSFIPFLFSKTFSSWEIFRNILLPKKHSKRKGFRIIFFLQILFLLSISFLISIGCNNSSKNSHRIDDHEATIYSNQNYSDLKLDSVNVVDFLNTYAMTDTIQKQLAQFYTYRNFEYAWLNKEGITQAAINFYDQLHADSQIFSDKSLINNKLDSLFIFANDNENKFLKQTKSVEQLELLLTATFFQYAEKVYGGATTSTKNLGWFIPRKKKSYQVLLDSLVANTNGSKIQEPVNEYYIRLKEKLKLYRDIQQKGGFTQIAIDKKVLKVGDSATYVLPIKQHLVFTGDLKTNDNSRIFTQELELALKNFQHRMGLVENGRVDTATLKELNETVDFRIKQIMVNLERLRWVPVKMEKDYLLVNIPEYRLHVFENQKQIWQTNVVVGKAARRTSIFRGNISTIVLNPYWGIPTRIVQEEILPKISRNPNYLAKNNMEVIDGNYRQKPGVNNALGKIKFLFPNNYSIYLHDTPSKSLFKENARAFSHGCIRVENPKKLAFHLLKNNIEWPESRVIDVLETNENTNIKVSPTLPVYIAYFTAWVDNTGQMNFRHDLYNRDNKLSKEVFGE